MMASEHESSTEEANPQLPSNTPDSRARRAALKKMIVGTGVATGVALLPERWAKPVVDRVQVPAHAQTSPQPPPATTPAPTTTPCDIAGTYCGGVEGGRVEIEVDADGSVDVTAIPVGEGAPPSQTQSTSVPVTGGDFSVDFTFDQTSVTVSGTVICNSDSIAGTVEVSIPEQGSQSYSYTATTAACNAPT